jgi:hypothetical protein
LNYLFNGEVQLAGWIESHTAGAKVTFWLSNPSDLDAFRSLTTRKGNVSGQRLAMALVEIKDEENEHACNDDIAPILNAITIGDDDLYGTPAPHTPIDDVAEINGKDHHPGGGKLSNLAAMFGNQPDFYRFILNQFGEDVRTSAEAAAFIRHVCGVKSRAEIDHNKEAEKLFHEKIRKPYMNFVGV